MSINRVTGDGWWRIFRFAALAHARARKGDNSKNLSPPVTCHLLALSHFLPNGNFQTFPHLKIQAGCRQPTGGAL
jgi:hypothetical protein